MVNGTEIIGASCSNPSEYISWDGVHYSHAANKWIANQILNGKLSNPPIPITGACHKLGHSWSQALSSNGYLAIMQWKSFKFYQRCGYVSVNNSFSLPWNRTLNSILYRHFINLHRHFTNLHRKVTKEADQCCMSVIISLEVGTSKNFVWLLMETVDMEFIFDNASYKGDF